MTMQKLMAAGVALMFILDGLAVMVALGLITVPGIRAQGPTAQRTHLDATVAPLDAR